MKKENGEMEIRNNDVNGKVVGSAKKTIEIDPKFTPFNRGKLWGQTKDEVVYVVEDRNPGLMLSFYFFNKNTARRTSLVYFSPYLVTVRNYMYELIDGNELLKSETAEEKDISGLLISSEKKVHSY